MNIENKEILNHPDALDKNIEHALDLKTETKETAPMDIERTVEHSAKIESTVKHDLSKTSKKSKPIPPSKRDEVILEIEKILQTGLEDTFQTLSPVVQQEFKLKGEQTAVKIKELMEKTKIKVKKILKLIIEWLSILPGANLFFLEQEAKIKTDKIIELKQEKNNS